MKLSLLLALTLLICGSVVVRSAPVGFDQTCSNADASGGDSFCTANLYCDGATAKCVKCTAGTARDGVQTAPANETTAACNLTCGTNYYHEEGTDCPSVCGTTTMDHTKCQANFQCDGNNACEACATTPTTTYRLQTTNSACAAPTNTATAGQSCSNATGYTYCAAHHYCADNSTCVACASGTSRNTAQSSAGVETTAQCSNACTANYYHVAGTACPSACGTTTLDHTKCQANFQCAADACEACATTPTATYRLQTTNSTCAAPTNTATANQTCSSTSGYTFCAAHLYCDSNVCVACPTGKARTSLQSSAADETDALCAVNCTAGFYNAPGTACVSSCGATGSENHTKCLANYECVNDVCTICTGDEVRAQDSTTGCAVASSSIIQISFILLSIIFALVI